MTVSCERCGRQYDAALFEFGRTISCACGGRVGVEYKTNLPQTSELKFFADVNVARLVRWLRAVGIDTVWEDAISDEDLVKRAIREKRYVLTLDKKLLAEWRADNIVLLLMDEPFEQFRAIVARFKIEEPTELFTRCLVCNTVLRTATAEGIAARVPPRVRANQKIFHFCPQCEKIYWKGSHTERMQAAIEKAFEQNGSS